MGKVRKKLRHSLVEWVSILCRENHPSHICFGCIAGISLVGNLSNPTRIHNTFRVHLELGSFSKGQIKIAKIIKINEVKKALISWEIVATLKASGTPGFLPI